MFEIVGVRMKPSQAALKLILDELEMDAAISTLNERKAVQKAVYIAQAAGVDLGYRYNWYVHGPYSPALTKDYFALDEAIASGESAQGVELRPTIREILAEASTAMKQPSGVPLEKADWLELVASVHFLITEQGLSTEAAAEQIRTQKPHVFQHTDEALAALRESGLLPK